MGSKGSQTSTVNTQSNQTYTPTGAPYLTSALGAAAELANKGTPTIPTAPVAGFSGQQQQAFGLAGNTGIQNPYLAQAQNYFSPQGAQAFYNPMAQNVTNQLQNIFGQQQQQNNANLIQSAGGVGADRIAVGQGNLANQQGLAAGQTYANLYGQAVQQAQSAGYGTAGLGGQAQQANMQDIQSLLGVGGLQQQLSQAQLNAPYQQQLAQTALPYQLSQWYSGQVGGLAPALGGTSVGAGTSNQVSQYNPSLMSQITGIGGIAGGLFGKGSGGAVPSYQGGGSVSPIDVSKGLFARSLIHLPDQSLPPAQAHVPNLNLNTTAQPVNWSQQQQQGQQSMAALGKALNNSKWGDAISDWSQDMYSARGGRTPFARGGFANPYAMLPHFDDGGGTGDGGGGDGGTGSSPGAGDAGNGGVGGGVGTDSGASSVGEGTSGGPPGAVSDPGGSFGVSDPAAMGFNAAVDNGAFGNPAATTNADSGQGTGFGSIGESNTSGPDPGQGLTGSLGINLGAFGIPGLGGIPGDANVSAPGFGPASNAEADAAALSGLATVGNLGQTTEGITGFGPASIPGATSDQTSGFGFNFTDPGAHAVSPPPAALTQNNPTAMIEDALTMLGVADIPTSAMPPAPDIGASFAALNGPPAAPSTVGIASDAVAAPNQPALPGPNVAAATPAPAPPSEPSTTTSLTNEPGTTSPGPAATPAAVAAALSAPGLGGAYGGGGDYLPSRPNTPYGYAAAIPVGYSPPPLPFAVKQPHFGRGGPANPYQLHGYATDGSVDDDAFELGMSNPDQGPYQQLADLGVQRGQIDAAAATSPTVEAAKARLEAARPNRINNALGILESSGRGVNGPGGGFKNQLYGQYAPFQQQYGAGEAGIQNFAKQYLKAKPNATFGDFYGSYVTGTGKPGAANMQSLLTTTQPGARGAYNNLMKNSPIDPRTPLSSLLGGDDGATATAKNTLTQIAQNGGKPALPAAPPTTANAYAPTNDNPALPKEISPDPNALVIHPAPAPGAPPAGPGATRDMQQQAQLPGPPQDITPPGKSIDETTTSLPPQAGGTHGLFGKEGYFNKMMHDPARMALIMGGLSAFTPAGFAGGFQQGMQNMQHEQSADLAAKRLEQEANFHRDAMAHQQFGEQTGPLIKDKSGNVVENPAYFAAKQREADIAGKFAPAGNIIKQNGEIVPVAFNARTGQYLDGRTQKPIDFQQGDRLVPAKQVPVNQEDAHALASYAVTTGDYSRINALGITSEARQEVQHQVTQVQRELGISDAEMGNKRIEWEGRKAGARVLGIMEARMGSAAIEAEGAIKQARGVIERLPRTSFLPFNELLQLKDKKLLNPDQTELYGRTQAIVNTYAAVMSRGANVTTDAARAHGEALLNTAGNAETYNRMLDTMLSEINMAKDSPLKMRELYAQRYGINPGDASKEKQAAPTGGGGGGGGGGAPTGGGGGAPPASMLKEGVNTKFKGDGGTWTLKNGQPVRVQ